MPSATTGDRREPHLAVINPIANKADGGRQIISMGWEVMERKRQAVLEEQKDKPMRNYIEINKTPH